MESVSDLPVVPTEKKRPGRPRKTAPVAAPTFSAEQFEQLIAVLASNRQEGAGIDGGTLKDILQQVTQGTAQAMQKAMKPENHDHPGISCFSYPEGDKARPKPTLPFEMFVNGYPMHMFPETEHWRELELACQLTPGEYTALRKDGSRMAVTVAGTSDADGNLTKLEMSYPVSREDKWLIPPKHVLFYQMVHRDRPPRQAFMEGMQEYFGLIFGPAAAPVETH